MNTMTSRRLSVAAMILAAGSLGTPAVFPSETPRPQTHPAAQTAVPPPAASGGAAFEDTAKFISGLPCENAALKKLQESKELEGLRRGP